MTNGLFPNLCRTQTKELKKKERQSTKGEDTKKKIEKEDEAPNRILKNRTYQWTGERNVEPKA